MEAVLFDNDGTIADTQEMILRSFRHAMETVLHRSYPDEAFMAKSGIPLAEMMSDFSDDPQVQQELLDTYRAYNHRIHDELIRAFPGEIACVSKLSAAGVKMGVVTSKMHALAQRGLDVLGLAEYMDVLIGADDCERAKPDPEPVLMGCAALGTDPASCAYVGDSPFDIRAGRSAGCMTVAVTWGMHDEAVLRAEHPDFTVASFDELRVLVESLL